MAARKATHTEEQIAVDEGQDRSLLTGEVLKEKHLCPLVIIRSRDSGVHIGYLVKADPVGRYVELVEARRLWQWSGANTLSEVSREGTSGNTRISKPVHYLAVFDVCEVLYVAEKAAANLTTSRWG